MSRILLIQGHPDPTESHFCHGLAQHYAAGAEAGGHELRSVDVASLSFPLLRSQKEWEHGEVPPVLKAVQDDIAWAQHLVLFFPLWMGDMPALLKGMLEQVFRPSFAFRREQEGGPTHKGLTGRSARVVVTMGMPALIYRYYFRAHSVRSLERNILGFVGVAPVRETLIGQVDGLSETQREQWLLKLQALGRKGE